MELKQIKAILEDLSTRHNDNFDIEVSINGRLTKTLGRVMNTISGEVCTPVKMEFSKQMLESIVEEDIISIIKHEWAHYFLNKTTKRNQGHNAMFKQLCDSIGCHGTTTIEIERTKEIKYKYTITCKECGAVVANYNRKCKTTENPQWYKSKCCGGHLNVVQNY